MRQTSGIVDVGDVGLTMLLSFLWIVFLVWLIWKIIALIYRRKAESRNSAKEAIYDNHRPGLAEQVNVPVRKDSRTRPEYLAFRRKQQKEPPIDVVKVVDAEAKLKMTSYQYHRREFIMTENERRFYKRLFRIIGKEYLIFPQIHLTSLLKYDSFRQSFKGAFGSIRHYSVDYVLCDPRFRIACAIELDDSTHQLPERMKRDASVEEVCANASLPLVRIPLDYPGDDWQLRDDIMSAIIQAGLS